MGIIYSYGKPPPDLPDCVIVDSGENYTGLPLFGNDQDLKGCVPIHPDHYEWKTSIVASRNGTETSTHTIIPLRLCYAWTIWKAQGQTITPKIVVSLIDTEMDHGLTYTTFSRVRKASDIGIINISLKHVF